MSIQSDKIREYFHAHGIQNREVAEKLGLHEGTISNILSGRFNISKTNASKLADIYGFDIRFLMTGIGDLFPPGGIRIQQHGNTNTGDGAGSIHLGTDEALRAEVTQLRDQLQRERDEKARLLSIIETITGK